ncbi:MAG: c-type cytochrome [Bacteroidales bacterium]|nr:c-type cytochrome [Bacteroidales bacterium]
MVNRLYFSVTLWFLFSLTHTPLHASSDPPSEWSQCKVCHVMGKRLIGPDLTGVTGRRSENWLIAFIRNSQEMIQKGDPDAVKLWEEYKVPMPPFEFTDAQIRGILEYIKDYVPEPEATAETKTPRVEAPSTDAEEFLLTHRNIGPGNTQPTFLIFLGLIILSILDLSLFRIVRVKFIHIIVIVISVFVCIEIVVIEAQALGRQQGYSPEQPVWFSHKVHAGQNKIDCLYCHSAAPESKSAGIPGTDVCMNCHNVVRNGKQTGEAEIAKVLASWEKGIPIRWIRVHNLPDHVFFSHAQHVNAGRRQCAECHGPVEKMDKIVQVESLGMGWCIQCHRTTHVRFAENEFYRKYTGFNEEINTGKRTNVTVDDVGGNNCQMCHY